MSQQARHIHALIVIARHRAREKDRKFTLMVLTEAIRNNPMMEKYKDDMIQDPWIGGKVK